MKTIKLFALILALAFLWACSSSSSGGGNPTPVTGTATFISNGGNASNATTGVAGNGGGINFDIDGDVSVTRSGSVDTSFTVPTYASNYGTNKLTISSDTAVLMSGDADAVGDIFLVTDNSSLYQCLTTTCYGGVEDTDYITITGLEVQTGFTLTLPANYAGTFGSSGGGSSSARIEVPQNITIDGTIKPVAADVQLSIRSTKNGLLQIGTTGLVTTKQIAAGTDGSLIYLYGEVAINNGTIDASGSAGIAAGIDGGAGGGVDFEADTFLYNTGYIYAKGGASTTAAGGKGRHIHLFAYYASLFNSGTIDNSGGNGATSGGNGGYNIRLVGGGDNDSNSAVGGVILSGSVQNKGGTGGTGDGGYGGYIDIESYGGKIWSNATISTTGGASTAAAGGYGGNVDLNGNYGEDYEEEHSVETKGIIISGNINLSGGNGVTGGGYGGTLSFDNDYSDYGMLPSPVAQMVGYASFTMNGGTGGISGGNGGQYEITTYSYNFEDQELPVGFIINEVPVTAKGGAGILTAGGQGGYGGSVDFETQNENAYASTITTSNSGAIEISGGAGDTGGNGGWVHMYGYGKLTNSGAITAKGGAGTTTGGSSSSDGVWFWSSYDVENTGAIDVTGGSGATGGVGAAIYMYAGGQVRNSADLTAAGGAGTTDGGNGGEIDLLSEMLATSNSGILSVAKGTGGSTAVNGEIYIDWVLLP